MARDLKDRIELVDELVEIVDDSDAVVMLARLIRRLQKAGIIDHVPGIAFAYGSDGLMSDAATTFAMASQADRVTWIEPEDLGAEDDGSSDYGDAEDHQ
jgi:hypothetical protein